MPLLSYTVLCNSIKCFKYLISNGADPNIVLKGQHKDSRDYYALITLAEYSGNIEMFRILNQTNSSFNKGKLDIIIPALISNIYGKNPNASELIEWFNTKYSTNQFSSFENNLSRIYAFGGSNISQGCYDGETYYPIPGKETINKLNDLV